MDCELAFLEELGVDLGQRRSRETLARYLQGLRVCNGRRSLANIAAAVAGDGAEATRLIEKFNYQLNDRQGRNGRGWWAPAMMRALGERALGRLKGDRPRGLLLVPVYAPHLGRSLIVQSDIERHTAQVVASLVGIGFGPSDELEALPIGWRLAFDGSGWDAAAFERSEVPLAIRREDHVGVPASAMLANVGAWEIPRLPILAGGTFAELRYGWLAAGRGYVVEWKAPLAAATAAAIQHPAAVTLDPTTGESAPEGVPRPATLQEEIEQRGDHWREKRERDSETTSSGLIVRRTDLMTKERTVESAIEIGENAWCAHLPDVPDDELVDRALALDALRKSTRPIYRRKLCELGLDDYRGRRFAGWHAHRALVSAAHLMNRERIWAEAPDVT